MGYNELLHSVQDKTGYSAEEAEDALQNTVETLAIHLTEGERQDFASQLPEKLQDIALSVLPTDENSTQDIVQQVMEARHIDETRATESLQSVWSVLKESISDGEIQNIKAQLPDATGAMLG